MRNDKAVLGKVSLWTAIIGFVLPMCLGVLVIVFVLYFTPRTRMGPSWEAEKAALIVLAFCCILFVILEATALGCGIAARQTATGIAGLVISSVLFLLALGLIAFVLVRSGYFQSFSSIHPATRSFVICAGPWF